MANKKSTRAAQGAGTIRQRPDGRWEARVTVGHDTGTGKQIQKSVYGRTQKEVREKLTAITAEIDNGTYIVPSKLTVGQWLDTWIAEYMGDKKYLTVQKYSSVVRIHLKPALGAIRLTELSPIHIQKFYNQLQKTDATGKLGKGKTAKGENKPLSVKTVRLIHGVLSKALSVAVLMDLIRSNPAERVTLPKMERKEIHPLTDEQIRQLMREADSDEYGEIIKLILFTGLREAEAVGLTWDCVDFKAGTLKINKQLQCRREEDGGYTYAPLKNDRIRVLTVAPYVMDLLQKQREKQILDRFAAGELWQGFKDKEEAKTAPVFTRADGQHMVVAVLYRHYKKLAERVGAPESRVHDLRHTYAVLSLQNEDSIKTVQQNLGHATAAFTLDVYGHVSEKMKQESADRM